MSLVSDSLDPSLSYKLVIITSSNSAIVAVSNLSNKSIKAHALCKFRTNVSDALLMFLRDVMLGLKGLIYCNSQICWYFYLRGCHTSNVVVGDLSYTRVLLQISKICKTENKHLLGIYAIVIPYPKGDYSYVCYLDWLG